MGREFWGKGIATAALAAFLEEVTERPIYARAAKDNVASLRVLRKCGFAIRGEDRGYANARGIEVEEYVLVLDNDEMAPQATDESDRDRPGATTYNSCERASNAHEY